MANSGEIAELKNRVSTLESILNKANEKISSYYQNNSFESAVPRCDNADIDSGDVAWLLTSVALVLMMTIPGKSNNNCTL